MDSKQKLERFMQDDWEIHGDAKELCLVLKEEIKRLKSESVDCMLRRRDAAQARRDDEKLSLGGRYEAAIEKEVWERAALLVSRV